MMNFVLLVLAITVAIMLATGLTLFIVMSTVVMDWYVKKINKITDRMVDNYFKDEDL